MKKAVSVNINAPCHENWAAMTPADHGRFCQACSKQVIDFTTMNDQQILDVLAGATGNICGRLKANQLDRYLEPAAVPAKLKWWCALLMPLLLFWNRISAQKNPELMGKVAYHQPLDSCKTDTQVKNTLVGQLAIDTTAQATPRVIQGSITDQQGNPMPGATIEIKEWNKIVVSDNAGNYKVSTSTKVDLVTIRVSSIGYEALSRQVVAGKLSNENFNFTRMHEMVLGMVVVSAPRKKIASPKKTVPAPVKPVTPPTPALEVYPNPVTRGQQFSVRSKTADNYTLQVLNNNGSLLYTQSCVAAKNNKQSVHVPQQWLPGIYYVQLLSESGTKLGAGKLVVK